MTEHGFADGRPVPVADDRASDDLLMRCCMECGVSQTVAMDVLQFYEENAGSVGSSAMREFYGKFLQYEENSLSVLMAYLDRQRNDARLLRMTLSCFLLAKGMTHLAGARNATEVARRMGLAKFIGGSGKATAQKCLDYFIRTLRLPPLVDQRDAKAREKMSRARKRQVMA